MNIRRKFALYNYLVNPIESLKPVLAGFLPFFLPYLFGGYDDALLFQISICLWLFLAGTIFLCTTPKRLLQRNRSIRILKASNLWEAALEDFTDAQEVIGFGKIGKQFYYGFHTGVMINMNDVTKIDLHSTVVKDSDGDPYTEYTIRFYTNSSSFLMCEANRSKWNKARQMLLLLKDRCRITPSVLNEFTDMGNHHSI